MVYALVQNVKELIYVGISGRVDADGRIVIRKAGLGGMKDRIVNGHQFGKVARKRSDGCGGERSLRGRFPVLPHLGGLAKPLRDARRPRKRHDNHE